MTRKLLFVAALWAGVAQAQTVIVKCVDAHGGIAYTTDACAPGQTLRYAKTYAAVHDDPRAGENVRRADEQQQARYRSQDRHQSRTRAKHQETERDRQKRACATARLRARDARGKGHGSATLVRLDKQAVDACFGL